MYPIAAGIHTTLFGESPAEKDEIAETEPSPGQVFTIAVVGLNASSIPLIKSFLDPQAGVMFSVVCYLCNESTGAYAGQLNDACDGSCEFTISKQWTKDAVYAAHDDAPIQSLAPVALDQLPKQNLVRNRPNKKREEERVKYFGADNAGSELANQIAGRSTSAKVLQAELKKNNQSNIEILNSLKTRFEAEVKKPEERRKAAITLFGEADAKKWPKINSVDPELNKLRNALMINTTSTVAAAELKKKNIKWDTEVSDTVAASYSDRTLDFDDMIRARFLGAKASKYFFTYRTIKGFELNLQKSKPNFIFIATEGNWAFSKFGKQFFSMFNSTFGKLQNSPLVFVLPSFPLTQLSKKYPICLSPKKVSFFFPRYEIYETRRLELKIGYTNQFSHNNLFETESKKAVDLNRDLRTFEDCVDKKYTIRYFEQINAPIVIEEGMEVRRPLREILKEHALGDIQIRRIGFNFDYNTVLPFLVSDQYMAWKTSVFNLMTTPELYHILLPLKLYIVYINVIKSEQFYYKALKNNTIPNLISRGEIREAMRDIIYSSAHFNKDMAETLKKLREFLKDDESLMGIVRVLEEFHGVKNLLSDGSGCSFFEGLLLLAKLRSDLKRHVSNVENDFGQKNKKKRMESCRLIVENTRFVFSHFIHRGMVYRDGQFVVAYDPDVVAKARTKRHGPPII